MILDSGHPVDTFIYVSGIYRLAQKSKPLSTIIIKLY